jgi:hypothetical protein
MVDFVALICDQRQPAQGAHLVMNAAGKRFIARFDDDSDGLYQTGECPRRLPAGLPPLRRSREQTIRHAISVKRGGEAATWLALRRGKLVVVAEHGDASYVVNGDPGTDWDVVLGRASARRSRVAPRARHPSPLLDTSIRMWPTKASYMELVCAPVP